MFVVTGLAYGGAEIQVAALSKGLRQRGWDVSVVSLMEPRALTDELRAHGVEIRSLGMKRGQADWRGLVKLRKIVREFRPDIVHSHMVHANLLARVVRVIAPVPGLICTAHNTDEGAQWRYVAYRLTDRLCDHMTNVSAVSVEASIERGAVPAGKIECVPNGVDFSRFRVGEEVRELVREELGVGGDFLWLAVGRLEAQKDYPNLLHAFADVARGCRSTRLAVVGDGPLRGELKALANRLGVAEKISWLGLRDDVPHLLKAADAYVMSSEWEGLPMVLLEASAAGLPIVATDVGGVREIVAPEAGGTLVAARDHTGLADAMRQLMGLSADELSSRGAKASAHARSRYSLDAVLDRWEEMYAEYSTHVDRRHPAASVCS